MRREVWQAGAELILRQMADAVVRATYTPRAAYDGATGERVAGASTAVRAVFTTEATDPAVPMSADAATVVMIPVADLEAVAEGATLVANGRRYKLTQPRMDAMRVLHRVKAKEIAG